jgi:hypothetical protein
MAASSREILRIEAFYHIAIWLVKKKFSYPPIFSHLPPQGGRVREGV